MKVAPRFIKKPQCAALVDGRLALKVKVLVFGAKKLVTMINKLFLKQKIYNNPPHQSEKNRYSLPSSTIKLERFNQQGIKKQYRVLS